MSLALPISFEAPLIGAGEGWLLNLSDDGVFVVSTVSLARDTFLTLRFAVDAMVKTIPIVADARVA